MRDGSKQRKEGEDKGNENGDLDDWEIVDKPMKAKNGSQRKTFAQPRRQTHKEKIVSELEVAKNPKLNRYRDDVLYKPCHYNITS